MYSFTTHVLLFTFFNTAHLNLCSRRLGINTQKRKLPKRNTTSLHSTNKRTAIRNTKKTSTLSTRHSKTNSYLQELRRLPGLTWKKDQMVRITSTNMSTIIMTRMTKIKDKRHSQPLKHHQNRDLLEELRLPQHRSRHRGDSKPLLPLLNQRELRTHGLGDGPMTILGNLIKENIANYEL